MFFHAHARGGNIVQKPPEKKMDKNMYCLCGFTTTYGSKIGEINMFL